MAKIDCLEFTYGRSGEQSGERLHLPTVVSLVGPNESGKSLALTLIQEWYDGSHDRIDTRIYKDASFTVFDQAQALQFLPVRMFPDEQNLEIWGSNAQGSVITGPRTNLSTFCDPDSFRQKHWRSAHLAKLRIKPTLESILSIMNEQDARPFSSEDFPENIFQLLLFDRSKLDKVNRLIKEASGFYMAIELVKNGKYRFQLNPNAPPNELPGMLLSKELSDYYKQGVKPATFGEGLRTFFGLVLSIFPFEHKLVLLDEPELHLHPPLARRLAQELVREIRKRNGQLIVATHSPDFIAGCIDVAEEMAMVRLTHSKSTSRSTTTIVSKPQLEPFITNRVVRNTDALSGIFHNCVVVVEGALDKIAYSEFNRCLQTHVPSCHIRDVHFVSAGSCLQVLKVTEIVRRTGTPTASILDFDVLYDGVIWDADTLAELGVPLAIRDTLVQQLAQIKADLQLELSGLAKGDLKLALKHQGIGLLKGSTRTLAEDVLTKLITYAGVFVLSQGEMETLVANTLCFSRINLSKDEIVIENGMKKLANNEFQIPEDLRDPFKTVWSLLSNVAEWVRKPVE